MRKSLFAFLGTLACATLIFSLCASASDLTTSTNASGLTTSTNASNLMTSTSSSNLTTSTSSSDNKTPISASDYTTSISISANSYLSGADRSFDSSTYAIQLDNITANLTNVSYTDPTILVVQNNYLLGKKVSTTTLCSTQIMITKNTGSIGAEVGSASPGTRAFDVSTQNNQGGMNGFTSNPVYLQNY